MGLTSEQLADAYAQYAPQILRYCRKWVGDPDAAEEAAAEVWRRAAEYADSYEDRGFPVTAWLYRLAFARVGDVYRRQRRQPTTSLTALAEDVGFEPAATRDELGDALRVIAGQEDLAGLLDVLTPEQRRVLELRYLEDRTLGETAQALGTTTGAVKALQSRALAQLQERQRQLADVPMALKRRILPRRKLPRRVRRERLRYRGWSDTELAVLEAGYAQGQTPAEIAAHLERSENAVKVRLKRRGLRRRDQPILSARDVAVVLGVRCAKTVARWIEAGELEATQGEQKYRVTWAALLTFLRRRDRWMAWHVGRITDDALRAWATELRAGAPPWLTPGEVAKRYHVTRNLVNSWIKRFGLPATRYGNWWVWEADLAGWIPPYERPRDWGRNHPRPGRPRCATPGCARSAFYGGQCKRCRYGQKQETPTMPKLKSGRTYTAHARETTLTMVALASGPVHYKTLPGDYDESTKAVQAYQLTKIGALVRVGTGMYDLGPEAPEWAQLLRRYRAVITRGLTPDTGASDAALVRAERALETALQAVRGVRA